MEADLGTRNQTSVLWKSRKDSLAEPFTSQEGEFNYVAFTALNSLPSGMTELIAIRKFFLSEERKVLHICSIAKCPLLVGWLVLVFVFCFSLFVLDTWSCNVYPSLCSDLKKEILLLQSPEYRDLSVYRWAHLSLHICF